MKLEKRKLTEREKSRYTNHSLKHHCHKRQKSDMTKIGYIRKLHLEIGMLQKGLHSYNAMRINRVAGWLTLQAVNFRCRN